MNKVQIAYYILLILFIIQLVSMGVAATLSILGGSFVGAVVVLLFYLFPLLSSYLMVYLTKDYKECGRSREMS